MKWRYPPDLPKAGDFIVAYLEGCKIADELEMMVREGEGLGHILKWIPSEEWVEKEDRDDFKNEERDD